MSEIHDKVISILEKYVFNKDIMDTATPDSNITKDLKINSARIVDIVLDIEDEFEIEIENKLLEQLQTIQDVINIIQQKVSATDNQNEDK